MFEDILNFIVVKKKIKGNWKIKTKNVYQKKRFLQGNNNIKW